MFSLAAMSNSTSVSEEASLSSETRVQDYNSLSSMFLPFSLQNQEPGQLPPQLVTKTKKKRNQPGNPDPDAEVIALSPRALMTTNRFVCEICNKGFQRDQNLQLHRRGHNLPWKLRQKSSKEGAVKKRVYVCPEISCVHHHPSRALGDLTGIKKHFSRKHGEKKWKCDKCSKRYAVRSDWKAHVKTCGTREYRCDCGTLFSRKDSFITHRAFCDALAEESARLIAASTASPLLTNPLFLPFPPVQPFTSNDYTTSSINPNLNSTSGIVMHEEPAPPVLFHPHVLNELSSKTPSINTSTSSHLSATALLQRASTMGSITSANAMSSMGYYSIGARVDSTGVASGVNSRDLSPCQRGDRLTRNFLGVESCGEAAENELLLDLVTSSTCIRGHEPPSKHFSCFPQEDINSV